MLSSLVRLVPAAGICSLPSCDWFRRNQETLERQKKELQEECIQQQLAEREAAARRKELKQLQQVTGHS
eukprot:3734722-Pyramimonas_sp.AAC.1